MDQYTEAHVLVAAIRVLEHQKKRPPTIEETCEMIAISLEAGYALCRKLKEKGIVRTVEGNFGMKLFVEDHLRIEEIPRGEKKNDLAQELAQFQKKQQNQNKKVEAIQEELARKRHEKFAEIEAKLKKELLKK
jgi:DNA-binding IscR family transcriptional regulator